MRLFPLLLSALVLAGCAGMQPTASTQATTSAATDTSDTGIKPFAEIITADFEADEGLITLHQDDQTLHFEIPNSVLGEELLLVTRIARTADNVGYGGEKVREQVVRWERMGDRILLRRVAYSNVAEPGDPIARAVENSNLEPIIQAFDIKAETSDGSGVVIDATGLYTTDVAALGLQSSRRSAYGISSTTGFDKDRSYLVRAAAYPRNVELRHVVTYKASDAPSNESANAITLEFNQSLIQLPDDPMTPRLCDERVGFFSVRMTSYSSDQQKAETPCYVTRWRLEPSDPEAYERGDLVEPVKQIVYYIDPATPEKWRPYLKQGVEDWNRAFEKAGFRNAIRAADPPSPEEDPEFSPEDVRYSVIRYFASDVQNAYGPHVSDPRTGEILESDIGWYHNVMNLLRNWYFVQTAAVNPEARGVEFRDEVMGELIRFVSAHEVGHTLGFPHNWGSSYAVPVDSLRSPTYTEANGTAPSIMDYARFNYIAQPGDGVTNFMALLGDYDDWVTQWGYSWTGMDDPEAEKKVLNEWVVERADNPYFFYGAAGPRIDPRSQNEDLGDDAVYASDLGVENLKRILDQLVDWTAEDAKDYVDLEEMYGQVVGQWNRYVGHVARWVGGYYEDHKTFDQDGPVYTLIPEDRQRDAIDWLDRQVFTTPAWMIDQDVLRRIEGEGTLDRIRARQAGALNVLLETSRLERMAEAEAMSNGATYTMAELMNDLQGIVWRELDNASEVDVFRRNLQRAHVQRLHELLKDEGAADSDVRPFVRGQLVSIRSDAQVAAARTRNEATRLHLLDVVAQVNDILDED